MKVWKNLLGKNNKIHVDEIAVTPGLLLGDVSIEEMGSSENGEYVKWGNGWMVCLNRISVMPTWKAGSGADFYYSSLIEIPFPKQFVAKPFLIGSTSDEKVSDRSAWLSYVESVKTFDKIRFYISSLTDWTGGDIAITYLAIGRWK